MIVGLVGASVCIFMMSTKKSDSLGKDKDEEKTPEAATPETEEPKKLSPVDKEADSQGLQTPEPTKTVPVKPDEGEKDEPKPLETPEPIPTKPHTEAPQETNPSGPEFLVEPDETEILEPELKISYGIDPQAFPLLDARWNDIIIEARKKAEADNKLNFNQIIDFQLKTYMFFFHDGTLPLNGITSSDFGESQQIGSLAWFDGSKEIVQYCFPNTTPSNIAPNRFVLESTIGLMLSENPFRLLSKLSIFAVSFVDYLNNNESARNFKGSFLGTNKNNAVELAIVTRILKAAKIFGCKSADSTMRDYLDNDIFDSDKKTPSYQKFYVDEINNTKCYYREEEEQEAEE